MNTFKTGMLMIGLTGLVMLAGSFFGRQGMILALALACGMNFIGYWFSDRIVLAMYRAQEVTREDAPRLHGVVEEIARKMRLPMPRVCVMPSDTPNAFATGRSPRHAAVAVTRGIMDLLSPDELRGVIAHEMAHVNHRDILTATIVAVLAGTVMLLATMMRWTLILGGRDSRNNPIAPLALLVVAILAPIAALVVQLWISRTREYAADEAAARVIGSGVPLANALQKLQACQGRGGLKAGPATAHLFIVNPLSRRGLMAVFSTHPALEDRIERLVSMRF